MPALGSSWSTPRPGGRRGRLRGPPRYRSTGTTSGRCGSATDPRDGLSERSHREPGQASPAAQPPPPSLSAPGARWRRRRPGPRPAPRRSGASVSAGRPPGAAVAPAEALGAAAGGPGGGRGGAAGPAGCCRRQGGGCRGFPPPLGRSA